MSEPDTPNQQVSIHSAARIAVASGLTRQAVYAGLDQVEPAGVVTVNGREVDAWRFADLPVDWQCEIAKRGVMRGFENGEDYLRSIAAPWVSAVPWKSIPPKEQTKALKLMRALQPALRLRGEPSTTSAETEGLALQGYRAQFGYAVSARQIRRLIQRTVRRDAGEENWDRVEIFLDDRACSTRIRQERPQGVDLDHSVLGEALETLENRLCPTLQDRAFLWDQVFDHYEELTESTPDTPEGNRFRRAVKASLVHYLATAVPGLCSGAASIRKRFDEKLIVWREGGRTSAALADRRPEHSGRNGAELCNACLEKLAGAAVELDGNKRQAWRRLMAMAPAKGICANCRGLWRHDVRSNKSYLPISVDRQVAPLVDSALSCRRGPKHRRLISPHVRRDWNDTAPGDWSVMDDATPDFSIFGSVEMPLTYRYDDAGRLFIGRIEMLFECDARTDYPRGFEMILGEPSFGDEPMRKASYNMVHQRLLVLHTHDRLGLPHKGWIQENGPWRNRLNDGERLNEWEVLSYGVFSNGIAQATSRRIQRTKPGNPRSKIVERVFRAVWDRMKCHKGYLGNNERMDRREVVQDFISRARSGKENPANELLEISEFRRTIEQELMAFAKEPQNGMRLPGVSPEEAWLNGIGGKPGYLLRPQEKLGDTARWLLSSHETKRRVKDGGVTIRIGSHAFSFWGRELEPYQHQEMLFRFNLEEPQLLSCRAMNGSAPPFTVRARVLPATTATREDLSRMESDRASWMRRGKVIYDSLPHPLSNTIARDRNQPEAVHELGRQYVQEEAEAKSERTASERKISRLAKEADALGMSRDLAAKSPARAEQAVRLKERARKLRAQEQETEEIL